MTTKQESKLKMYYTTGDFLVKNENTTMNLPDYPAVFSEFKDVVSQIKLKEEQQKNIITGITKDKKEIRNTLIGISAENSGKVYAFATIAENKTLMDEVHFSPSELTRMTDISLRSFAESFYKKIDAMLEKIEKYGINQDTQKHFAEAIAAYNNSIAKPRVSIAEKREATKELELLFTKADKLLDKIDAVMNIIRYKDVNFYTGYRTVRKLVNINSGPVALRGFASDIATNEPLKGSVFTFRSNGTIITKRTADKGIFYIRKMKPGQYEVIIKKQGYKEKSLTVSIDDGQKCDVKVSLEKL